MILTRIKRWLRRRLPTGVVNKIIRDNNAGKRRAFYNLGRYSYALDKKLIKPDTIIGDFVSIASGAQIGPGNHPVDFITTSPFSYHFKSDDEANLDIKEKTSYLTNSNPVIIGNDVWIGTNSVVMNGIKIGDGAVVGANAVVTHDVEPYSIVAGVPAKHIRYRFDEETAKKIQGSKWWNLPDEMINDLPMDDIERSLLTLSGRCEEARKRKICFVITSCIIPYNRPLNNADNRSVYSSEKRAEQTIDTIASIRKYCKNANIILVDNGAEDPKAMIGDLVEKYIYVGSKFIPRIAASRKNKSIGEAVMLLEAVDNQINDYELIFKISGRYKLNEEFDLAEFSADAFNFLNYVSGRVVTSVNNYIYGSHSTRLYAFPGNKVREYRKALKKSILYGFMGESIEFALPNALRKERFFYHRKLGLSGNVAVDGNNIEE